MVIKRREEQAACLVVPAEQPVGDGQDFASGVAAQRREQHGGTIEQQRSVAGDPQGRRIPRGGEQEKEHSHVQSVGQGPGRPQRGRVTAGPQPLPSQQHRGQAGDP
jgi:hypothetical protein